MQLFLAVSFVTLSLFRFETCNKQNLFLLIFDIYFCWYLQILIPKIVFSNLVLIFNNSFFNQFKYFYSGTYFENNNKNQKPFFFFFVIEIIKANTRDIDSFWTFSVVCRSLIHRNSVIFHFFLFLLKLYSII